MSQAPTARDYSGFRFRDISQRGLMLLFAFFTAVIGVVSLYVGPAALDVGDVTDALLTGVNRDDPASIIIWQIRVPRMMMGALVGASLGLSGAVLQGYLRNPLAEPGIIGVTSGSALGGVIAIHTGLAASSLFFLPVFGLVGSFVAVVLIVMLAGFRGSPLTLILAGVAVTSLAGALTSLVLSLSNNPFAMTEIIFWILGSLQDRSMDHVIFGGPIILVGLGLLLLTGRELDALTLGEEGARNLGVDLDRLRMLYRTGGGVVGRCGHGDCRCYWICRPGGAAFIATSCATSTGAAAWDIDVRGGGTGFDIGYICAVDATWI